MAHYATFGRRCLAAWWTAATLLCWTGSLVSRAAGVSLHDRGPCPDVVDGVCIPNRRNFGWYAPKWRQWPGDVPTPVRDETSVIQREVPEEVPPFELPPPEQEADPPGMQRSPRGLPAEQPESPPASDATTDDAGDAPPALPPGLQDKGLPQGTPVDPNLLLPVEPDPFPTTPPATDGAALPAREPAGPAAARTETIPASLTAPAAGATPSQPSRAEANPLRRASKDHVQHGPAAPRAFVAASPPRRLTSWTPSRRPNPLRSD